MPPSDIGPGLLDAWATVGEAVETLDTAVQAKEAILGDAAHMRDLTEATAGEIILGGQLIERGRNMTHRLVRKEEPNAIDVALEGFDFLFGDGTGSDE